MRIEAEKFTIALKRPFRIAHGASDTRDTILVKFHADGLLGRGEGALPPYYPSRAGDCLRWLEEVRLPEASTLEDQVATLPPAPPRAAAARVALEIALCDLWGQMQGAPLWQLWGLDATRVPQVARTIPICLNEEELREILAEDIQASFLKLKLGSGDFRWDEECIRLARRQCPAAGLCVDVNEGWSVPETVRLLPRAEELGLAFVEQPIRREVEAWQELRAMLSGRPTVPLVADESLQSPKDLERLRGLADGVNIKLLKAGGLLAAKSLVDQARQAGFRVMIGVMVETGVGRTAAAQLAPLAEWLDIDPPQDIPVAPYSGFAMRAGKLALSHAPGLGLHEV